MSDIAYFCIATTEDTEDPVLRVQKGKSHMEVILDTTDKYLNVWYVVSHEKGDMKAMLDHLVEQLPINSVRFIAPMGDKDEEVYNEVLERLSLPHTPRTGDYMPDANIQDVVHGFKETVLNLGDKQCTALVGEWEPSEYEVDKT